MQKWNNSTIESVMDDNNFDSQLHIKVTSSLKVISLLFDVFKSGYLSPENLCFIYYNHTFFFFNLEYKWDEIL